MIRYSDRIMIRNISAFVMGAVILGGMPMGVRASASLGTSAEIGISADLDAAESTGVLEDAMNDVVLDAFHLDGYSNRVSDYTC